MQPSVMLHAELNFQKVAIEAQVASVSTFDGCIDILETSKPDWAVLENVPAIEREEEESILGLYSCFVFWETWFFGRTDFSKRCLTQKRSNTVIG